MALTLTEDVIRNRVSLSHDNLEDVKSLSLPGTYHEKIVSLGSSLRKFSRLKSLDLSRNALESLEGIEGLTMLEKLNLYYNNIASLDELKRLKHTSNLKELDLRLNPVTRSEPDYRLYLIHMLPSLQKLDDRSVRDRERQAALTHFSSSQATEMTYHPPKKEPTQKPPHPRVELTSKLGKPSVLDDDDVAVLDLVSKHEGDLSRPRPLTGSAAREPAMEEYSLDMLKNMTNQEEVAMVNGGMKLPPSGKKRPSSLPPPRNDSEIVAGLRERYPNIANIASEDLQNKSEHKRPDPNLKYQDEVDAYSKYKSHGFFTPHINKDREENPGDISHVPIERGPYPPVPDFHSHRAGRETERDLDRGVVLEREKGSYKDGGDAESRNRHRRTHSVPSQNTETFPTERGIPEPARTLHQSLRLAKNLDYGLIQMRLEDKPVAKQVLFRILDMVDRYWNGSKSLHQHAKFLGMALDIIENVSKDSILSGTQPEINSLKNRVEKLHEENTMLRDRLSHQQQRTDPDITSSSEAQLKTSLKQARDDIDRLREELQAYVKENARMQRKLENQESAASHSVSGAASSSQPGHLEDIQRQNDALSREIEGLRGRLKQYAQMQEMASMLQESHKSLVQTNDHLLRDIDEERRRHKHEVEQMHWSYNQLKQSMSFLPSSVKPDSTMGANKTASVSMSYQREGIH